LADRQAYEEVAERGLVASQLVVGALEAKLLRRLGQLEPKLPVAGEAALLLVLPQAYPEN
jgi:hypothetical protein